LRYVKSAYITIYWWYRNYFYSIYSGYFFGADKIPEIARGLGKGMRTLKDATNDIKHEVTKSAKENGVIDTEVTQSINEELNKVRDEVEDFAGSVKRKS